MAWDRLRLMVALVVLALLVLVALVNRREGGAPADRIWERIRWIRPTKKKAALILAAFVGVGSVVVVNRLNGGEKDYLEIRECRDKDGHAIPPPWKGRDGEGIAYGRGVGDRVIFSDDKGNEISCPSLLTDPGLPRQGG